MAKLWLYNYGDHTIKVINKNFDGSELYIDDVLCDQFKGVSLSDRLTAKMESGELVTATLEGTLTMNCSLCVDGEPQQPIEVK